MMFKITSEDISQEVFQMNYDPKHTSTFVTKGLKDNKVPVL